MEEPLVPWVGVLDINLCWAFTARAITIIVAIVTKTPDTIRDFTYFQCGHDGSDLLPIEVQSQHKIQNTRYR